MKKAKSESDPKPMGRPRLADQPMRRVTIRLSEAQIEIAMHLGTDALGDRELGRGIRRALYLAGKRIPK